MIGLLIKTLLSLANAKREPYDRTISLFTTGESLPVVNSLINSLVRDDRDSRANLMPINGDLYQIKL